MINFLPACKRWGCVCRSSTCMGIRVCVYIYLGIKRGMRHEVKRGKGKGDAKEDAGPHLGARLVSPPPCQFKKQTKFSNFVSFFSVVSP